jgi:hypothetical protein
MESEGPAPVPVRRSRYGLRASFDAPRYTGARSKVTLTLTLPLILSLTLIFILSLTLLLAHREVNYSTLRW